METVQVLLFIIVSWGITVSCYDYRGYHAGAGLGKLWTGTSTTSVGTVRIPHNSPITYRAYHEMSAADLAFFNNSHSAEDHPASTREQAGKCCEECLKEFPSTVSHTANGRVIIQPAPTMYNYDNDLSICRCLKPLEYKNTWNTWNTWEIYPDTDTDTEAPAFVSACGNPPFPDKFSEFYGSEVFVIKMSSVEEKGYISGVGDGARCCEECNKIYPGTEVFAYLDTDEERFWDIGNHDQACMCYGTLPTEKPSSYLSNLFSGICWDPLDYLD